MNKSHLQWIVTVIFYLFPQSSPIDQEYASPTGPDSELHDLGLALAKDFKEKSELEDGLTETELTGETSNDELPDFNKVELLNKKDEVTPSTGSHDLIIEKVEAKVKEEGLVKSRNETVKEPAEQFLQINDLKIKPIKNNSVIVKVLEKRDIENNEKEMFKNISDGGKLRDSIINFDQDNYSSTKSETQSNSINNYIQEVKFEEKEDSRKFRDINDEENNSNESLISENSVIDILPKQLNLCFDKSTSIKCQPKRKLNKSDLENIIPNIQRLQADHDEEDSSKDMQGMIGVVESIMESIGGEVREELGLPENSKSKNVINLNSPESDDDKVQKILAVIASGLRDSLKDQSSSKYCLPLPRELHSFLIWLMHGYEGGANSPPTKSEQRSKPFYLFHEKSHRRHNSLPSENIEDCPSIVDNSKPIAFDDLLKGNMGQIDQQDVSPELNYKKKLIFAEKSLYGKPTNMGRFVISPANNIQIGRFPGETERDYFQESRFPLRKTYVPKHLLRTRCLGDTSIRQNNKSDDNNMEFEDTIEDVISPDKEGNTSLVREPESYRELRNISDSTDVITDTTTQQDNKIKVIKRDLSTNSKLINKTLHPYNGNEDIWKKNYEDVFSPCPNANVEVSSNEISSSLENLENDSESLKSGETIDFPINETIKEKRRGKVRIFKDPQSNEVVVKLLPNSSNSKVMAHKEMSFVRPLFNSAVRLKNLTLNHYENESNIDKSINKPEDDEIIDLYHKDHNRADGLIWKGNEIDTQTDTISNDDKGMNCASKKKKQKVNVPYQMDGLFKITTLEPICEETFLNLSDLLPQIYFNTPASDKRNKYSKFPRRKESVNEFENDSYDNNEPIHDSEELNKDNYYDEKEIENALDEYNVAVDKHNTVCRDVNGTESDPTSYLPNLEQVARVLNSSDFKCNDVDGAISENKRYQLIGNTTLKFNNTPGLVEGSKESQLNLASNAIITSEMISANKTLVDKMPNLINNSIIKKNLDKILDLYNKGNQDKETMQCQEIKDVHCESGLNSNISQKLSTILTNPEHDIINSVKKVSFGILKLVNNNASILEPAIFDQNASSQSFGFYENPNVNTAIEMPELLVSKEKFNPESSPLNKKIKTVESRLKIDLKPSIELELLNKSVVSDINENVNTPTLNKKSKLIASQLKETSVSTLNSERPKEEILDSESTIVCKNQKSISELIHNIKSLISNENYKSIVAGLKGSEPPFNPAGYFIVNEIPQTVESEEIYETTKEKKRNLEPKIVESHHLTGAKEKFNSVVSLLNEYIESPVVDENLKAVMSELKNNSQSSIEDEYPKIVILEVKENCEPIIGEEPNDNVSDFIQNAKITPADENDKIIVSKVKRFLELRVPNEKPKAPLSKLIDHLKYFNKIEKPMVIHLEIKGKFNSTSDRKPKLELSDVKKNADFNLLDEKLQAVVQALKSYSEYSILNKNPKVVILKVKSKPQSIREDKNFKVIASKLIRHLKCSIANKIRGIVVFIVNDHPESILLLNEKLTKVLSGINETSADFANETFQAQVSDLKETSEATEVGDKFKANALKIKGIIDSNYVNGKIKSKQTNLTNESNDKNGNLNTDLLEVKGTPSAFVLEMKGTTESTEQSNKAGKKHGTAIFNLKGSTESFMFNEEIKVEDQEANETTNLIEVNKKLNVALSSLKGISESTQASNALRALTSEVIGTTESPKFKDGFKPEVLVEVNETTESILIKDNLKSEMVEVKGTTDSNNIDEHFKSVISNLNGSSELTVVNGKGEALELEVKETTELNTETEKLRKMTHVLEVDSSISITTDNNEKLKEVVSDINENTASRVVNEKCKAFVPEATEATESTEETEKLKTVADEIVVNGSSELTENNEKVKTVLPDLKANVASTVIYGQFRAFVPGVKETTEPTLNVDTENLKTMANVLVLNGTSKLTVNNEKIKTVLSDFKENTVSTVSSCQFRAFVPEVRGTTEQTVENEAHRAVAEVLEVNGTTELTENIEKVKTVLSDLKGTTKSSAVEAMFKIFVPEVMGTSESTGALNVLTESAEKFKSTGFDLKRTTESIVRNENQLKTEIASYLEFKGTTASSVVNEKPKAETFELNKNTDSIKPIKKVNSGMMIDFIEPTARTLNNEKTKEVVFEVHGNPLKTLIIDFKGSTESPIFNMKPKAVMSEIGRLPESDVPNEKHKTVFIQLKETFKTTKNNKKFERILSAVKETTESTLVQEKTKTLVSDLNRNPGSFDLYEKHKAVFIELKGTTKPTKADGKLDIALVAVNETTESTLVNDKTKTIVSELNKKPESIELNKKHNAVIIKLNGATQSKVNASLNALLSAIGVTSEAPLVNEKLKLKVSELSKHPASFELNKNTKAVVIELKGVTKPTQVSEINNAIASVINGTTEATLVSEKPKSVISELNKDSDQKTESIDINEKLKTVLNEMIGVSKDAKVNEMINAIVSVLRGSTESTSVNNFSAAASEINVKPESIDVDEKLKLLFTQLKATTESSLLNDKLKSGVNKSIDGTNRVTNAFECKQNLKTLKEVKIPNETNIESKKPLTLFLSRLEGTTGATTAQDKSDNVILELTEKLKSSSTIEKKPIKLVPNVKIKLESSILNKNLKPVISDIQRKLSVPNAESNNLSTPHQNKILKFSMVKKKNKILTLQPKENLTSNAVLQSGNLKSLNQSINPKTMPQVNYQAVHSVLNDKSKAMSSVGKQKIISILANKEHKPDMNITDSTLINGKHSQIELNFKTMSEPNEQSKVIETVLTANLDDKSKTNLSEPSKLVKVNKMPKTSVSETISSASSGKALSNMLGNKSATTISNERVSIKDIENIKLNTAVSKLKDNTKLNISLFNFKTVKGKPESPRTLTNKNTKTTPYILIQNLNHKSNILKENSQMTVLKQKEKFKSTKINKKQPTRNFHSDINNVHLQNLTSNPKESISTTTKYIPLERISKSVLPNLVSKRVLLKNDLNLVNSKFNSIKFDPNFKSNLNTVGSEKHKRSVNKMSIGGKKCISKDEENRDFIDKKTVKKVIDDLIDEIDSNKSAVPSKTVSSNTIDWSDLIKLSEQMKDTHSFDMANILKCLSDIINEAIKNSENNNDNDDPPNECKEKIDKNMLQRKKVINNN